MTISQERVLQIYSNEASTYVSFICDQIDGRYELDSFFDWPSYKFVIYKFAFKFFRVYFFIFSFAFVFLKKGEFAKSIAQQLAFVHLCKWLRCLPKQDSCQSKTYSSLLFYYVNMNDINKEYI